VLGPEFAAAPALLFGPDRFHPSAAGYSHLASVLLPSVLAALGVITAEDVRPEAFRGEAVLPVSLAAVEAAARPGTEVDGTRIAGAERGDRGRWALLRRRRRHPKPTAEEPEQHESPDAAAVEDPVES
jgi:hypothetical protein